MMPMPALKSQVDMQICGVLVSAKPSSARCLCRGTVLLVGACIAAKFCGPAVNTPVCFTGDGSLAWGTDFTTQESLFTGRFNVTSDYTCIPFDSQLHISINAGAGGFTATTMERVVPLGANGIRRGKVKHRFVDHPELAVMNLIHTVTASCA